MPAAALSRPKVISEARQLAEQVGLDQLTMTALAQHLGVRLPSLYKHIASLAELQRSMSTIAARELGNEIAEAAIGHDGSTAVVAVAHAYRRWALRHPDRYLAAQVPPAPGDFRHAAVAAAVARTFATALAEAGGGDSSAHRARAVHAALHGFVTLESSRAFGATADVDRSFDRTIRALNVAFFSTTPLTPPRRLGHIATAQAVTRTKEN